MMNKLRVFPAVYFPVVCPYTSICRLACHYLSIHQPVYVKNFLCERSISHEYATCVSVV